MLRLRNEKEKRSVLAASQVGRGMNAEILSAASVVVRDMNVAASAVAREMDAAIFSAASAVVRDMNAAASTVAREMDAAIFSAASGVVRDMNAAASTVAREIDAAIFSAASGVLRDMNAAASAIVRDMNAAASTVVRDMNAAASAVGRGMNPAIFLAASLVGREMDAETFLAASAVGREMDAAMLSEMVIPNSRRNASIYEIAGETKSEKIPSIWKQMKGLSLNDQVKILSCAQLSDVDLRLRWQFAVDLFYLLREEFPTCEIYPFGSLITGLADKSSDIDIYLDWKGESGSSLGRVARSDRLFRIHEIQSRVGSLLKSAKCPHTGVPFATDVECIGSRVPIVRFRHFVSGVNCDLSFGSKLSVNNSKLIKFYLDYDPRVKPFIVFLRNWAEYWNLAGCRKIKKYALTLLAIVFFAKKKIIPTIEQLQICASAERFDKKIKTENHIIDDWDSSFCTDLNRIHQLFEPDVSTMLPPDYHENPGATFLQTLTDFFELISKYDLKECVACPLVGQMIPKGDLTSKSVARGLSSTRLRAWRNSYITDRSFCQETKILKPLVIQDPFDLDHNVALLVDKDLQEEFSRLCKEAHAVFVTFSVTSLLDVFSKW